MARWTAALDDCAHALQHVPNWTVSPCGTNISRSWVAQDFRRAVNFVSHVADLAENGVQGRNLLVLTQHAEGHHPDIHLERYNRVEIQLTTWALGA